MPKKAKTELNESQLTAIQHGFGPLLVVAGAGTGKTRVITERIKNLIQQENVKPKEMLALTFTEKAAAEMLNRIGDVMPLGYEEPWVCTFHSFAERILSNEGLEIGLDPSFKILSGPDQWLLLRKNLFKFDIDYFRPLGNPTKFISGILKFISRLQDENISPEEFCEFANKTSIETTDPEESKRWKELSHMYFKYQELKIQNSRLDFGDLITWTIKLLKERPTVLKKYQEQFKHVLIDEFQDTNYAQYELIKLLCPAEMGSRSLTVVGDDSQSIYKFRGAAVSNIMQFMQDFPNAKMVTLLQNYRSFQEVLDPAYDLIQNNNPDTLEVKLNISKKLVSEVSGKGITPQIVQTDDAEDEVTFVISKILEILGKEPEITYKDFAILARANGHLDPFVMALRKYGLPYQLVGNRGLYDRDEVRDVLAFLKVIINPTDTISLYRVLNIPCIGIDFETIAKMLAQSRFQRKDLWEILKETENEGVKALIEAVGVWQGNITKKTPSEFVFELVHGINYLGQYTKEETVENQLSINNLDIFLKRIQKFEIDFHDDNKEIPTIVDLVDYLDLMIQAGENPAQSEIEDIDTINLMTVHASKGLEFPVVFIINVISDRFPTRNKADIIPIPDELVKESLPSGDEHIQEERRLFYVGMTRAKKYLFITLAKNYGGKRERTPSGYLNETKLKIIPMPKAELSMLLKNKEEQSSLFGVGTEFRDPKLQKVSNFVPDTITYSQIDNYLTCPLQYKYAYVLKIPTAPAGALSFGNTIHYSLKDLHYRWMFGNTVSEEELVSIYEKNWQPLGYLEEDHRKLQFEKGKDLLKKYYEKNKDNHIKHVALERSFSIRISGTKLNGRIDRIDPLPSGGVEIIDYKTGKAKTQKDIDKDLQVSLYAVAAQEALGLKPELLSLYFVETGEKISTTRTPENLEEIKRVVSEVVDNIKQGKFDSKPGMHCEWCSYKEICPFAQK